MNFLNEKKVLSSEEKNAELEENLFVCPHCNKHHRISPKQRFDIIFGKSNYEILTTILVDIQDWHSNNSANKVIGDAASGTNAYLTSLTKAVNGYIYLVECMCMEVPAGGERNLNVIFIESLVELSLYQSVIITPPE